MVEKVRDAPAGSSADPPASGDESRTRGEGPRARGPRPAGVDAETQAGDGGAEWAALDLGRAVRLLASTNPTAVRNTLRRLHVRFWHAPTARLVALLRHAGAPAAALKQVKAIVDTCRICRQWSRPTPRSITTTKLATAFNEVVQWDIVLHRRLMISHLMDECIRWAVGSVLASKEANSLIEAITRDWLRPYSAPRVLIADGETGLTTEHASQWLDRWQIQLKTKAPGEHAQMVERHHELLRRLLRKVEAQLTEEGLVVPMDVIVAECFLAKNVMVSVAGQTPSRALYGRDPPMLSEFEPVSETQLDDGSGGLPGHSRHHMRVREIATQSMVQQTAQLRLERAMSSRTRLAAEQLELQPGDLVDFWRRPATKDESGWRGPAAVTVAPRPPITVRWQGRSYDVRLQDLRRALGTCASSRVAWSTIRSTTPCNCWSPSRSLSTSKLCESAGRARSLPHRNAAD